MLIEEMMTTLQYRKLSRGTYKSSLSNSEVEHYVLFKRWGSGRDILTAFFAFRQIDIEKRSYELLSMYRGDHIPVKDDILSKFSMKFNFEFLKPGLSPWPILLSTLREHCVADIIYSEITRKLMPLIEPVTDASSLYERLLADEEPCSWYRTNGAIRAAYLLQLGQKVGIPLEETRKSIQKHALIIEAGLHNISCDLYLNFVCEELTRTS